MSRDRVRALDEEHIKLAVAVEDRHQHRGADPSGRAHGAVGSMQGRQPLAQDFELLECHRFLATMLAANRAGQKRTGQHAQRAVSAQM